MQYSVNQIKKAGKTLIKESNNEAALQMLSYWRSTHEKPLNYACAILEKYTKRLFKDNCLIAHRLKRTPSIINKLVRFNSNGMQLTTMQDIGGCRIILDNINDVNKIVNSLVKADYFILRNDYIATPKDDGYRGIHLTGQFTANDMKRQIELQVRTKVQHAWATAVEIVDLFTKQHIKHNQGEEIWKDFFKHSSIVLGYFEKCFSDDFNILSNSRGKLDKKTMRRFQKYWNNDISNSMENVHTYAKTMNILSHFKAFTSSLEKTSEIINTNNFTNEYLLLHIYEIETNKFKLDCKIFPKNNYIHAEEEYIHLEKETINSSRNTVALISTSKVEDIQEAYPNYFADSSVFSSFIDLMVTLSDDVTKLRKQNVLKITNNNPYSEMIVSPFSDNNKMKILLNNQKG